MEEYFELVCDIILFLPRNLNLAYDKIKYIEKTEIIEIN